MLLLSHRDLREALDKEKEMNQKLVKEVRRPMICFLLTSLRSCTPSDQPPRCSSSLLGCDRSVDN